MRSVLVLASVCAAGAAKCQDGESKNCTGAASGCCSIGSYSLKPTCFDPKMSQCCSWPGGYGLGAEGDLCPSTGECCGALCIKEPDTWQCCHDQYGQGHQCTKKETCQVFGCGPAPPQPGKFCLENGTKFPPSLTIDVASATSLAFTMKNASCGPFAYEYDASGAVPSGGLFKFNDTVFQAMEDCLRTKVDPSFAGLSDFVWYPPSIQALFLPHNTTDPSFGACR